MVLEFRAASVADAPAIAALMMTVWPDDTADTQRIASLLHDGHARVTRLALAGGRVIGFVDAFVTTSAAGVCRWEVDLLAVDAASRGQGIARRLIRQSVEAGRACGATLARGLIHIDNRASERAFAAAGFSAQPELLHLTICAEPPDRDITIADTCLIPVETFAYRGVWLEGAHTAKAFLAARSARARSGVDVAGAVISPAALNVALASGYTLAGDYRWWQLDLTSAAVPAPR